MELQAAMAISAAGMRAQSTRMRVVSQNIANADTAANTPNSEPYRRKTISFKSELDRQSGIENVTVDQITEDQSDFKLVYRPGHPGADEKGYVKMPNVNSLIERTDMREANRSYEANLGAIQLSRGMIMKTIDVIGESR